MMSWDVIIPFLRGIEGLIRDPDISDILINGPDQVFVEKSGIMQKVPGVNLTEKSLQVAIRNIARLLGNDISEAMPILDARLPDGSRVTAIFPPTSVNGTCVAIRKFQSKLYGPQDLVRIGTLTPELLLQLQAAVEIHQNILISGGTATGKTTLLNALSNFIGSEERVLLIEDTSEIQFQKDNLVRLEARREQPNLPAISIRDLLKATLRLRPDRIILGEVRGGEAFDLLQALNTGHSGSLSTIHASSAPEAISRFATCVLMSGIDLPYRVIRKNIGESLDLVIQLKREPGKRAVAEVLKIKRYVPAEDYYEFETLYHSK
jgi:pilus assembly protein CpaF